MSISSLEFNQSIVKVKDDLVIWSALSCEIVKLQIWHIFPRARDIITNLTTFPWKRLELNLKKVKIISLFCKDFTERKTFVFGKRLTVRTGKGDFEKTYYKRLTADDLRSKDDVRWKMVLETSKKEKREFEECYSFRSFSDLLIAFKGCQTRYVNVMKRQNRRTIKYQTSCYCWRTEFIMRIESDQTFNVNVSQLLATCAHSAVSDWVNKWNDFYRDMTAFVRVSKHTWEETMMWASDSIQTGDNFSF